MNYAKKLYDLIETKGELLNGSIHIIDTSDKYKVDEREGKFRVYHFRGICFDIEKEYVCEPNEIKDFKEAEKDGFVYTYFGEWEGFENITVKELYEWFRHLD